MVGDNLAVGPEVTDHTNSGTKSSVSGAEWEGRGLGHCLRAVLHS